MTASVYSDHVVPECRAKVLEMAVRERMRNPEARIIRSVVPVPVVIVHVRPSVDLATFPWFSFAPRVAIAPSSGSWRDVASVPSRYTVLLLPIVLVAALIVALVVALVVASIVIVLPESREGEREG